MKRRRYYFKARYKVYVYEEFDVAADTDEEAEEKARDWIKRMAGMDRDAVPESEEIISSNYEKAYAFMEG